MGEFAAGVVILHLADEGGGASETSETRHGVGGGAARDDGRRPHQRVKLAGALFVDELHRALVQTGRDQCVVLGAGENIDNRIADAENVDRLGHKETSAFGRNKSRRFLASRGANK